jgi:heat shock protein HtpX
MAAYGLYTHIASNKFRSMLLLAGLFLLIYVLVYAGALIAEVMINGDASVDYYLMRAARDLVSALPYATIGAIAWIAIAYFFHQNMIDAVTGGESVTRKEQPRLYNLLENLCISRGIPMPKLKIMDSPALNAFASGLNRRQYSVTVTTGLLRALNDQEIEAVLGHELTHIRNGS